MLQSTINQNSNKMHIERLRYINANILKLVCFSNWKIKVLLFYPVFSDYLLVNMCKLRAKHGTIKEKEK